jgi:hypothetical protein
VVRENTRTLGVTAPLPPLALPADVLELPPVEPSVLLVATEPLLEFEVLLSDVAIESRVLAPDVDEPPDPLVVPFDVDATLTLSLLLSVVEVATEPVALPPDDAELELLVDSGPLGPEAPPPSAQASHNSAIVKTVRERFMLRLSKPSRIP